MSATPTAALPPDPHAGPDGRSRGYIPTLDGWRAVAILLVMAHHEAISYFGPHGFDPRPAIARVTDRGNVGVDIFFGISGFLICSRLLDERRISGRIDLPGFYFRRTFRILPPACAYLLALGLLGLAGVVAVDGWAWLSSALFFRNYIAGPPSWDSYTNHFWSLAIEEHFYLIWPGLMVLLATRGRARRASLALTLVVTAWRAVDSRYHLATGRLGLPIADGNWRTDYRLDGLLLGCWMALLVDEPAWRDRVRRWLSPAAWALVTAFFFAATFLALPLPVGRLWVSALVPLMLIGTVLRPDTAAGRLLEWAPLRWVGRLSYSLYLWQQLFLMKGVDRTPLGRLQAFPLDVVLVFACALASYQLVERPMIEVGRRLSSRHKARAARALAGAAPPADRPARPDGVAAFD